MDFMVYPLVWILWLSILWIGFQFWGFGFLLSGFGGFRIWFSILGFWPFFRVSLDPVERCILVSGTRIGRHFKNVKKTEKNRKNPKKGGPKKRVEFGVFCTRCHFWQKVRKMAS